MSTVLTGEALERLAPAVRAAATAAGRGVPCDQPLAVADVLPGTPPALPGGDALGVTCGLGGAVSGRLCLLLSADRAEALQQGPLGNQELADALELALADAAAALATATGVAGASVVVEAAMATGADVPSRGLVQVSVTLHDGGRHVATLVVDLDDAGPFAAAGHNGAGANGHAFEAFDAAGPADRRSRSIELLNDVEMAVTVELGRTRMLVRDLLALTSGSVVELDRTAGSPVDVLVNNMLIARGEVVVIDEEFAVRITEIVSGEPAPRRPA